MDYSLLAMHLDESTNVCNMSQLMGFVRVYFSSYIPKVLLFCETF